MLGLLIPGVGMGGGGATAAPFGRIEFTIPRSTLEFAVTYQPLEFTLPRTVEEFEIGSP
jgi:hypothetical protein